MKQPLRIKRKNMKNHLTTSQTVLNWIAVESKRMFVTKAKFTLLQASFFVAFLSWVKGNVRKKDTVKTYLGNYILTRLENSCNGVNTVRATHFAKKCGTITNHHKKHRPVWNDRVFYKGRHYECMSAEWGGRQVFIQNRRLRNSVFANTRCTQKWRQAFWLAAFVDFGEELILFVVWYIMYKVTVGKEK